LIEGQGTFTFTIPQTGDYWIHVYVANGNYTLTVDRTTAVDLAPGDDSLDFYQFTASAGNVLRLAADTQLGQSSVNLTLFNSAEALLVTSSATARMDAVINGFVAPASGVYKVRVAGNSQTAGALIDYGLVVTHNALLDLEPNTSQATAQPLPANGGVVLGHLGYAGQVLWIGSASQNWNDGSLSVTQVALSAFIRTFLLMTPSWSTRSPGFPRPRRARSPVSFPGAED
jgi:hypothetical protein